MQTVATSLAIHALLQGAVDYAGLFPPASLDLTQAAANFVAYRDAPEAWMLGRFVVPAQRVGELCRILEAQAQPARCPWPLSVLSTGGAEAEAFLKQLEADLQGADPAARTGLLAAPESVEVRWPQEALSMNRAEAAALLSRIEDVISRAHKRVRDIFLEVPSDFCTGGMPDVLHAIAAHRLEAKSGSALMMGAKLRCGGTSAEAFPSAEQVAAFLAACTTAGVPFKLTAGLHHPLYHFDQALGAYMHGFLNVFTAAVLLDSGALGTASAALLLKDENAADFHFGDEGIRWRDVSADLDAIREARRDALLSFGSCSFDEPHEDLQTLGLF